MVGRQSFFGVSDRGCVYKDLVFDILTALVKKYIWECKLRFTVPRSNLAKLFISEELSTITDTSIKFNHAIRTAGMIHLLQP